MRRLCTTVAFAVVLSLSLFPARADAYIWAWLDDLSGPRFGGVIVEWRVYCRSESIAEKQQALLKLRKGYTDLLHTYEAGVKGGGRGEPYFRNAVSYMTAAITYIDFAIETLDKDPGADVSRLLQEAYVWQNNAKAHAAWAERLASREPPNPREAPGTPPPPDVSRERLMALFLPGIGVSFSLCEAKPGRRNTQFLSVNVGYAWDLKDANRDFDHRMVTVGASYNLIVSPSVTLGAGAGLATFSSKAGDSFSKAYVQPLIVDFRPFLLAEKYQRSSPWYHVLYFRGSVLTFPAGFEAGRFGNQTERFEAELIPTFGIHFDFSPVIQDMQGKWRRKQPPAKEK